MREKNRSPEGATPGRNAMANVWKIAPGHGAEFWDVCLNSGCIRFGGSELPNFKDFHSVDQALSALEAAYGENRKGIGRGVAEMILQFVRDVKVGDIVIANKGYNKVVGIGVVEGEYLAPDDPDNPLSSDESTHRHHVRSVMWYLDKPVSIRGERRFFVQRTLARLNQAKYAELLDVYAAEYPADRHSAQYQYLAGLAGGSTFTEETQTPGHEEESDEAEQHPTEPTAFDPSAITDSRNRVPSSVVQRSGQGEFRTRLLTAAEGRCMVTGCTVEAVLEAAHIHPYQGPTTDHPANGLLLRADIHKLFDSNLLGIEPETLRIELHPSVRKEYGGLVRTTLLCGANQTPSKV
ncbi:MAG: hypothetical protein C0467_11900 [Planctomycetaceae bacterium]|nr:hypothetical protein [Planctomycetaceae bacterium]